MRLRSAAFAALVLLILSPQVVRAQSAAASGPMPRTMIITGVLQPADGQAPRPIETVTVAVYADPTGGAPLWQETQNIAVDEKGHYSVLLGATQPDGVPAAVLAAGTQWLGLRFDRAGEVEGPRLRLTSVPYALRAADADTLGGRPSSAYALAAPTGAAGTKSAAAETGKTSPAGGVSMPLSAGTPNYIGKFVSATELGNSTMVETFGRLGVNTSTPYDIVHSTFFDTTGGITGFAVQNYSSGPASYSGMLFYDQNNALAQFQGFNNSTHEYRINNIAKNGASQYDGSINFMLGSSSKLAIASTGNVGIGTTTPMRMVQIGGSVDAGFTIEEGPSPNAGFIRFGDGTGWNLHFGINRSGSGGPLRTGTSGVIMTLRDNQPSGFCCGSVVFSGGVQLDAIYASGLSPTPLCRNSLNLISVCSSSRRYKTDVEPFTHGLEMVHRLQPVSYTWKEDHQPDIGFIAEDVSEIEPRLTFTNKAGDVEGVKYERVTLLLVNAVKEQQVQIQQQKEQLSTQQRQLDELRRLLCGEHPQAGFCAGNDTSRAVVQKQ